MINFTDAAYNKLLKLTTDEKPFLKISISGGGCAGFQYDMGFVEQVEECCDLFEHNNLKYCVPKVVQFYIKGMSIDYYEELLSSGFKFSNPNAKSDCGCGTSFGI